MVIFSFFHFIKKSLKCFYQDGFPSLLLVFKMPEQVNVHFITSPSINPLFSLCLKIILNFITTQTGAGDTIFRYLLYFHAYNMPLFLKGSKKGGGERESYFGCQVSGARGCLLGPDNSTLHCAHAAGSNPTH